MIYLSYCNDAGLQRSQEGARCELGLGDIDNNSNSCVFASIVFDSDSNQSGVLEVENEESAVRGLIKIQIYKSNFN